MTAGAQAKARSRRRTCASSWQRVMARSRGVRSRSAAAGSNTVGRNGPSTSGVAMASVTRTGGVRRRPRAPASRSASAATASGAGSAVAARRRRWRLAVARRTSSAPAISAHRPVSGVRQSTGAVGPAAADASIAGAGNGKYGRSMSRSATRVPTRDVRRASAPSAGTGGVDDGRPSAIRGTGDGAASQAPSRHACGTSRVRDGIGASRISAATATSHQIVLRVAGARDGRRRQASQATATISPMAIDAEVR